MSSTSRAKIGDQAIPSMKMGRGADVDDVWLRGFVDITLTDTVGTVKHHEVVPNLVTQVGDQMYGEQGAGLGGAPAVPTGMRLGTGATAASKTGAGATIVTYITGSAKALDAAAGSSLNGSARRIQYVVTWNPGEATNGAIAEVALANDAGPSDDAGAEAETVSRAVFGATIDKQAADTLTVTWNHDLEGT